MCFCFIGEAHSSQVSVPVYGSTESENVLSGDFPSFITFIFGISSEWLRNQDQKVKVRKHNLVVDHRSTSYYYQFILLLALFLNYHLLIKTGFINGLIGNLRGL